ncbi:taxadiene 5-alpha hydroxylase-like [Chenopodium quinoa]|uniref:beta-amyrin 28-monooxygenase n=1 Tax=Chenopodium quinoa TaxID=63459 RepID=A0A803LRM6_CHEQI|nr:taxadiene 5-alpha hydroxylase-like [Chenopodium quinoa]
MADYINFAVTGLLHTFLASLIGILVLFMLRKHRRKARAYEKLMPPGEMGIPWIGETLDFYRALQKNRLFEDFIAPRIKAHGKTFKTRLMGSPTVIVNGAEANRFFLSNEFKLVVSSWPASSVQLMGKNSIMEKSGEQHRVVRSILTSCLSNKGLEGLVPKICKVVKDHLEKNWGDKPQEERIISLYKTAKFLSFRIMCECQLEMEAEEELFECFEKVLEGIFSPLVNLPGTSFWRAKRARAEIEKILVKLVRQKRKVIEEEQAVGGAAAEETRTLLSRLVSAMIRGEITEVEVVDNIVLLIFAAHDTSSFAIAMTFKMLAQHQSCYSLLLQEHSNISTNKTKEGEDLTMEDVMKMNYTWQVARESVRLFPPIFGSFRRATSDIEFDGFTIPQGWKVLWTAYGTHFSEDYFKDPMKFDPNRFEEPISPYIFVAFGGGPRVCAGYQLAKMNILIFVHLAVTNYNWSLVQPNEPIVMDPLPLPSQGMPLRVSPKV